ncbi:MAG: serine/threonine protein kinase [Actinobacteria bacterium]|nr:serine/threonine protein kinase [Actinomycetota bacterium]
MGNDDPTVVSHSDEPPPDLPPPVSTSWPGASHRVDDRYTLEEPIGSGGASVVWRAYDGALDRSVAMKILHPHLAISDETVERFHREAKAAARLTHPNVVPIFDVGTDRDIVYIVMELVAGPSLADLLKRGGAMDPVVVAALGEQVAAALGEAHAHGLVHRDVKPANILLTTDGVVKLTDFGIVKAIGMEEAKLTNPGTVVGTAAYIAPEQLQSDAVVDARADVYALGVVLYECLTGRPAYQGDTPTATAAARLHQELPSPRQLRADVPRGLDDVLVRATRRDPDERFPDGIALADGLGRLVPTRPSEVTSRLVSPVGAAGDETTTLPSMREPRTDPSRWMVLIVGTLLLATIAFLATRALGDLDGGPSAPDAGTGTETLPIEATSDFDPFGTPDRRESPDEVPLAHDGDPATAWTTEPYQRAPQFGNLKPGAGLWFDLGTTRDVAEVRVAVTTPGITVQVHAVDQLRDIDAAGLDAFAAWGEPVIAPVVLQETGSFTVPDEVPGARYWLLWITELAPRDDGRFEAGIAEVSFVGRS